MADRQLDVYIAGQCAGVLTQSSSGSLSFRYLEGYRGTPLSSSMPLATRVYRDKVVLPYLSGLLPEDPAVRRRIAAEEGVSHNNPFALLGVVGLDCPGAVQFCSAGASVLREEAFVPADDREIARRLALGRSGDGGSGWLAQNEHWSLGGQQSKFALRRQGGKWFSCEGASATTHIFKSGVRGLAHQALNEFVCMSVAAKLGIDVAQVEYVEFEGDQGVEPAIVIERYDRQIEGEGVMRLHQEDLCQALGCLPDNKYTMYGGPSSSDILRFLLGTGSAAQENVVGFLQMLFFNYLVAGTDAHAKNYSIMLSADGVYRLAPMYDVASIAPYIDCARWKTKPPKLAMSIGGENRVGCVGFGSLRKLAEQCDLERFDITAQGCADLIVAYAQMIPGKLAEVFDDLETTTVASAAQELRRSMEEPIAQLCERSIARLS